MSGTNHKADQQIMDHAPGILLIRPQIGENIGMAARAMLNMGLPHMHLTSPKEAWPNEKAVRAAAGADIVLNNVKISESTRDAASGYKLIFATTARKRDLNKPVISPNELGAIIRDAGVNPRDIAIMFGPEKAGLTNDDLSHAHYILNIPLNPGFSSLNLAQAVLLIAYELKTILSMYNGMDAPLEKARGKANANIGESTLTAAEIDRFFDHLCLILDDKNFWRTAAQKPTLMRHLKNQLLPALRDQRDLKTLYGIINLLTDNAYK